MMLLLLLASVGAAAPCSSLGEAEFRSLLLDAQAAIDRADPDLQRTFVHELEHRIPCLAYVPTPREWSDYLLSLSLVRFGAGGDWQTPLRTALWVRPDLDRGVGASHPIATFDPGSAPGVGEALPAGRPVFVDGVRSDHLPPATGLHLVQRGEDGYWSSLVVVDRAVPAGWVDAPIERPLRWEGWITTSLRAGVTGLSQDPDARVDPAFVPAEDRADALLALAGDATVRRGALGATVDVGIGTVGLAQVQGSHLEAGLGLATDPVLVLLGAGVAGATVVEGVSPSPGEPTWVTHALTIPYGAVLLDVSGAHSRLGARVGLGVGEAYQRVRATVGWGFGKGPRRLWAGIGGSGQRTRFERLSTEDLGAVNVQWQVALDLGMRWRSEP